MGENRRSFWATVPGLVTGLAGLLTGIVGLVTVLIQLGIVGGKSSSGSTPIQANGTSGTTLTTLPGNAGSSSGSVTATTEVPTFSVSPLSLDFPPQDQKPKAVTIRNNSVSATLTVPLPKVSGPDQDRFTAAFGTCTGAPLRPNDSCTVNVTFTASGPLRKYTASLQVAAVGVPVAKEVALTASTLL